MVKKKIVKGALHDGREEERVQGESGGERVKEGGRDKECPGCPAAAGRKGQLKKSCYPLVTVHRRVLQFLHSCFSKLLVQYGWSVTSRASN